MKKLIIYIFALLWASNLQAGTPPASVQKPFMEKFPKAEKVSWGKENEHEWEAEFQLNGIKMSANYSDTGIWLETEMAISATELPQIVSTSIKKKYIGWQITHAYKIETAHKGLLYEADIKSGMKKKEVLFQEDGTFIK